MNRSVTLEPGAFHLYSTTKLPTPEAGLVPFAVVPGQVTALADEPIDQITLSPNPADDYLTVKLTGGYRGMVEFSLRT